MLGEDKFSQSLTSALKATLHVIEQVEALKVVIDRELPAMFDGTIKIGSSGRMNKAMDAGRFVCTGMSWMYPISQRGKGRPRSLGGLWFWVRLAQPGATSGSLGADVPPFIAVEVVSSGCEEEGPIDTYDCPTSWAGNSDVSELEDIGFRLPLLASGKAMENGAVWWAGFAHRLGVLSQPRVIKEDFLVQAVALAKLLERSRAEPGSQELVEDMQEGRDSE